MQQFMRKFEQLNGQNGKVILKHCLFDRQIFDCDYLQVINDDERIGLVIHTQEKFLYKQNVKVVEVQDNTYTISDDRFTIIVKKL